MAKGCTPYRTHTLKKQHSKSETFDRRCRSLSFFVGVDDRSPRMSNLSLSKSDPNLDPSRMLEFDHV